MGLKRRWSPSLDSTQENHLETLWNAHGVEGSGHLGILPSDIPHDPHGLSPALASDASTGGMPFEIWNSTINPTSMFVFGQQGGFGETNGFASVGASQFGITLGPNGSPDGIEVDPLGAGDTMMTSSIDSGTTGLKKSESGDPSPDLEHHDEDEGDPADGDDDLDDHHAKADLEKPNKPANNNFVNKLHTMISDPKSAIFIWWTELGTR
jgi:hypothetical protein